MSERIPSSGKLEIYVARSSRALDNLDRARPIVAILPEKINFNDFGYRFYVKLLIRPEQGEDVEFSLRLLFKGIEDTSAYISESFRDLGDLYSLENLISPRVSLITEADDYETFIALLGFDYGIGTLRSMGDAVVASIEEEEDALELMESEEFHLGVLRHSNAYDALERGGRHLRPACLTPVEDSASDYVFEAVLPCADNSYKIPLSFTPDGLFRDRFSILVGRNGVGKSQLMNAIIQSLVSNDPTEKSRGFFNPALKASRVLVFSSVPSDQFPRSIPAWRGIDYQYFSVNADEFSSKFGDAFLKALMTCKKTGRVLDPESEEQDRFEILKEAFDRIGIWKKLYIPLQQGETLPHEIEIDGQAYVPYSRNYAEKKSLQMYRRLDWDRSPIILNNKDQKRNLSSGEYAIMRFTAQLAAAIERGSLLLLDEPETHLHPNLISEMMAMLDVLTQTTKSVAVIATHSAYVVREAPRRRVNVLRLNGGEIQVDQPRFQTFGGNIESISQFVFQDQEVNHAYESTLLEWADRVGKEIGIDEVIAKYADQLNAESLSLIARRLARVTGED